MAVEVMGPADASQQLFNDVTCTIIPSKTLTANDVRRLTQMLKEHGAEYRPLDPETGCIEDVTSLTHIISTTSDFPDYEAAVDHYVNVVRPSWVEICTCKLKLANPRQYHPNPAFFFSDVIVTCADIPEGDEEAICGGVISMGGQSSGPLTKLVTHIVALTLDNEKCEVALKKNLSCKIVLPHWFDDCLKLRRKIDEGPYLLPNPQILSTKPGPIIPHDNVDLLGASSPVASDLPSSAVARPAHGVVKVFSGKAVMLADDLGLSSRLKETIGVVIRDRGGSMVHDVAQADIYVCHYREGVGYIRASQAKGTDVGNLPWLYFVIKHDAWTSPMRRLLHYPLPRQGIPGFEKFMISLSNYTGEARVYLENLVRASGADFTKTMKQENTHLITAHTMSEKCAAAAEWNINLVNHLWLEESYAKCQLQALTNPRYTHFPLRTNLGEVVGQTQIDKKAVEKFFINPVLQKWREGDKMEGIERTAKSSGATVIPPSSTVAPRADSAGHNETTSQATPLVQRAKRVQGDGEACTPAVSRSIDGKENETPSSTGSRSAKERALSKLHDLAPDMALYQKELKRVGGVVYGGRKVSDPDRITLGEREAQARKRSHEEADDSDSTDEDDTGAITDKSRGAKPKKPKTSRPPVLFRIMISGDERWLGKPKKESEDMVKLRNLGILVTQNSADVTLLCAPRLIRTKKFAAAIASAPTVVHSSFLDHCLEHNEIPPANAYPLEDPDFETLHGFCMNESLERAAKNRRMLLKGWDIFCTEQVHGGYDSYREIVAANGGTCILYKGRMALTVRKRVTDVEENSDDWIEANRAGDEGNVLYLISSSSPEEMALWDKFRRLARDHDMVPRIVKPDWLLFVAMAQYLHWEERWAASATAD